MDLNHYVTFFFEEGNKKTVSVESNDLIKFNIPEGAFGFKIFDRPSSNIYKKGKVIIGMDEILNESIYYIGKILSLEDIKSEYGEDSNVYQKFIQNKFYGAVKSPSNFLAPLRLNQLIHILSPEELASIRSAQEQEMEAEA